jgi:hypothetical protein
MSTKEVRPMVDVTDRFGRVEFVAPVQATAQESLSSWSRQHHHDSRIRKDGSFPPSGRPIKLLDLGHGWLGLQEHGRDDICEVPLTNIKSRLRQQRQTEKQETADGERK